MNKTTYIISIIVLLCACTDTEDVKPVLPPQTNPSSLRVEEYLDFIQLDKVYKTNLNPYDSTPVLEYSNYKYNGGTYVFRAIINIAHFKAQNHNLDLYFYYNNVLVHNDIYIIETNTDARMLSTSIATRINSPRFDKACIKLTNMGDTTSTGIIIKLVSIAPY